MGEPLRDVLIKEIGTLSGERQDRLLKLVRRWRSGVELKGRPESLMALAGTLPKADADEMRALVKQECEPRVRSRHEHHPEHR